jgi:hypothetical protein
MAALLEVLFGDKARSSPILHVIRIVRAFDADELVKLADVAIKGATEIFSHGEKAAALKDYTG